jgi:DNA-binding YbaB/EbfC family protein
MSKNLLNNLMKQAQQMQEQVKKLQAEAGNKTVEASSGGGMVTVVVNGRQEVLSIKIDRSAVDPNDIDMLQDLVAAAVNEALRKSQEIMKSEKRPGIRMGRSPAKPWDGPWKRSCGSPASAGKARNVSHSRCSACRRKRLQVSLRRSWT